MALKKSIGSRKFTIRVHKAIEGGYTGQCIELPGAISEGETIEELKANMTEAIQLVLDTLEGQTKKDKKIVIEIPN
ncbi:type II toxin-antitoxin system HicB family antitoxin [Nitrososphaera sp.]|uniref:type II toxin-antitoxin system HicB family antitoxin n=1 Tax=Nitrososphaera sp. TaxID=1971748 RepID=UPI00307EA268